MVKSWANTLNESRSQDNDFPHIKKNQNQWTSFAWDEVGPNSRFSKWVKNAKHSD